MLAQAFYAQTLRGSFMFVVGAFCCMLVCDADAVLWLRFVFYPASRFCSKEFFCSRHSVMASAPVEAEKKLLQKQLQEMGSEELSSMVEHIQFLETCMRSKNKDSRIQKGVSLREQTIRVEKVQKGARKLLAVCRKVKSSLTRKTKRIWGNFQWMNDEDKEHADMLYNERKNKEKEQKKAAAAGGA